MKLLYIALGMSKRVDLVKVILYTHKKKIFFILNVESRQFYIHITSSLKVMDDITVEFEKFTQRLPNSPGLNQTAMCGMNLNS
jgi:hypothetical protein